MRLFTTVLLFCLIVFSWAARSQASNFYGDLTLTKGRATVIRNGDIYRLNHALSIFPVYVGDLIRVRRNSSALLVREDGKADLQLAANSVFHVQPWERRGKSGLLNMLFGRMRAKISGLTSGERFNIRTATSTIGVKGTGYNAVVRSRGETWVLVTESEVAFQGSVGPERIVKLGQISETIHTIASPPIDQTHVNQVEEIPNPGMDAFERAVEAIRQRTRIRVRF